MKTKLILFLGTILLFSCNLVNNKNMSKNNSLFCDPQTGVCEIPESKAIQPNNKRENTDGVQMLYFTDPICSACWGIEPQLKKLKLEYGNTFMVIYHLGGLLPGWKDYNGGGIQKPADVAHHWEEMSDYFEMPINGDVWIEDPLSSSYPPSIAFKAAEMQDKDKAATFLRTIREMLFIQKKNIAKWENIEEGAKLSGLDIDKLKHDYDNKAKQNFEKDLELSRQMGVRGFPTIIFRNSKGTEATVYGVQGYGSYEQALLKIAPDAKKQTYDKNPAILLQQFGSLTAKELSVIADISVPEAKNLLSELVKKEYAKEVKSKKGSLWVLKK